MIESIIRMNALRNTVFEMKNYYDVFLNCHFAPDSTANISLIVVYLFYRKLYIQKPKNIGLKK